MPTGLAAQTVSAERDPYLAFNAASNLAFAEGLLGMDAQAALHRVSAQAESAGLRFVELKALLYAGILAEAAGERRTAVDLLEDCLPRQLELGHINLVAQELCPRPELASLVLRRHRSNGLGPSLLEALSRHPRFDEAAPILRECCASQVGTWIDHLDAGRSPSVPGTANPAAAARRRRETAGSEPVGGGSALDELTARERQVLELMAQDRTNAEIAGDLFIALSTVKTHVNHILRKLGQTTRVGAVLEYQRLLGMTGND